MRHPTLFDAGTAAYSGTRPLSEVLETNQVMRAARSASLAEPEPEPKAEYLYGIRDGQVVRFDIIKWTPKRVRFATGNPAPAGYTGTDHLDCYVDREPLEKRGSSSVIGGSFRHPAGCGTIMYATRELAEAAAAPKPPTIRCPHCHGRGEIEVTT
jgi:hypothetical protein